MGVASAAALCGAAHAQSGGQGYDPGIPRSMQTRHGVEGGDPERGMVSGSGSDSRHDPIEDRGMKGTPNTGRSDPNPGMTSVGSNHIGAQSLESSRRVTEPWDLRRFGVAPAGFPPGVYSFPNGGRRISAPSRWRY
jgi:hypothetical protein